MNYKDIKKFLNGLNLPIPSIFTNGTKEPVDERIKKLTRENRYSLSTIKYLVDRYPKFNDDEIYDACRFLNMGTDISVLDSIYQLKCKRDEKKKN